MPRSKTGVLAAFVLALGILALIGNKAAPRVGFVLSSGTPASFDLISFWRRQSVCTARWHSKVKAIGQWNAAWDPFVELDPQWTDEFMATGAGLYASGVLPLKDVELLSIALDASYTHMYAPGTRRHIKGALNAGATIEEIMEVLKLCVAQGVQACNLGAPILAEELELYASRKAA